MMMRALAILGMLPRLAHDDAHWNYFYFFLFQINHRPEPHILLFRRPLGTDPQSGRVDPELARQARDEYKNQFGLMRK